MSIKFLTFWDQRLEAKIKSNGVNDVWCVDVVFDPTQHGTTVKFLTAYSH